MNNLKGLLLAVTVICIAAAPALAKRHGGEGLTGHQGQGTKQMNMLKVALDLSEQQQTEIQQIIAEQQKKAAPLREQVRANREAVREVMVQAALDEGKLQALMQEQSELRTEMMIEKHATQAKVSQVLTPEQQQKHEELRQVRKEHRAQKRLARQQSRQ